MLCQPKQGAKKLCEISSLSTSSPMNRFNTGGYAVFTSRISLRASVAAFALILGVAGAPAQAQAIIALPSASLEDSLNALSRQTRVQILADQTLLRGRKAPAIQGATSLEAALAMLLRDSNLTWKKRGDTILILQGSNRYGGGARSAKTRATQAVAEVPDQDDLTAPADASDTMDEIVVTGSHTVVDRREVTAPILTISSKELERVGAGTLYDLLRRVPSVARGEGAPNNNGDQDNGGAGFMNLRNLGTNRSLTLVNGHRRVSGGSNFSGIDLNMIPAGLVERVDIVTGGTSAIYGADAVTGVANILLKRDFDGVEYNVSTGVSQHGGADQYSGYILAGTDFSDGRGHFTLGASYLHRSGLMQCDRSFSCNLTANAANPANTGPNDGIPDRIDYRDVRYLYISYDPTFYFGGTTYLVQNGNIVPGTYDTPITTGATSYGDGGPGRNLNDTRKLVEPVETFSVNGNFNYEIAPDLTAYLNTEYTHSFSNGWFNYYRADSRTSFLNGNGGLSVNLDNPYLPDSVRQFMVANGLTKLNIDKTYDEFGLITNVHTRDLVNLETGLEGKLGDTFKWNAFALYGRSTDNARSDNVPLANNLIYASQVIADADGNPICANETARAAGCIPYNIFSDTISDELRNYILYSRRWKTVNSLFNTGAQISGDLLQLPAGAVKMAVGAEYRRESLEMIDDPLSLNGQASHSGTWRDAHPNLNKSFDVTEAYAELRVPVLADRPFVRELSLDGAYRFSHYSTIGNTSAWKFGVLWAPVSDLRVRASLSRSVRAPNLFELFGPSSTSFTNPTDPCEVGQYNATAQRAANCAALGISSPLPLDQTPVLFTSGSNADLREEVSNSWTAGFTYAPSFVPGLQLSADFWTISIEDAVQSYTFQNIVNYCTNLSSIDNSFCALVTRDPTTHQISAINGTSVNVAELKARGIDFSLDYNRPLAGGELTLSINGTRLIEKTSQLVPGDASFLAIQDGGLSDPHLRANVNVGYRRGRWSANITNRYLSSVLVDPNASKEYYEHPRAAARVYTDLDVRVDLSRRFGVTLGVNNLLDVKPPFSSDNTTIVGNYGLYDTVGRYFKIGLTGRL